ncbi:MAG TPA: class I SAM-dependent methyltransferase [Terriglobales bacterium]|nr:class I SAM-dependent methyltransferase [Terriglobales bacterium]
MPILSDYAKGKKVAYFTRDLPKDARILEVGCGDKWLGQALREAGFLNYTGLDVVADADIVGDIRDWRSLGIQPASFDVIMAFELIEHVDCIQELYDILKPGGLLMMTSPLPHMDWLCKMFEAIGLNQRRTSPHSNLVYFRNLKLFQPLEIRTVGTMAQWGVFKKPAGVQKELKNEAHAISQ